MACPVSVVSVAVNIMWSVEKPSLGSLEQRPGEVFLLMCPVSVCVIDSTRVASVQSEPGHQNLLIQPPLGRKRGLRQVGTFFVCHKHN